MLERYFTARMTLRRLRFGPSGPYVDGFAAVLERDGYAKSIAKRYLRAAVHLGYFLQQQGKAIADVDSTTPEIFSRHLATCCCPLSSGEGNSHHPYFGAKRYCEYLMQIGICHSGLISEKREEIRHPEPPNLTSSLRPQLNSAHAARCGLTLTRLCLHCWLAPGCESPRRWACDLPISRLTDC
jgi:hypothetical protein